MGLFIQQMGAVVTALDQRMKKLERLTEQRVTINSKQAKALQKRVQARSAVLCEKHGFSYAEDGEAFRRAIWRDLKAQYAIDDIHDLPAAYFALAGTFIDGWRCVPGAAGNPRFLWAGWLTISSDCATPKNDARRIARPPQPRKRHKKGRCEHASCARRLK